MDEVKRPIQFQPRYLRVGVRIEAPEYLGKGLDGKDYSSSEALQEANQRWLNQSNRYISPWTGKEYIDYQAMQRDERAYWEGLIKPEEKIINKQKLLEVKKI